VDDWPGLSHMTATGMTCRGGSADRDVVDAKGCISVPPASPSYTLRRVWLSQQEEEGHYFGLANLGSRRIRSSQVVRAYRAGAHLKRIRDNANAAALVINSCSN